MKKALKLLFAATIVTSSITTIVTTEFQAEAKSTKKLIVEDITKEPMLMYLDTGKKNEIYYAHPIDGKLQIVDELFGSKKVIKYKKIVDKNKKTYVIKNGLVYYKNKKFTGTYKTKKMSDNSWSTLKLKNGKIKKALISYYQ